MNQRDTKYVQMTTAPVEKLVCSFAVPSIVSMLISSIYNIVDTFFVGRLDTQSTAALGVIFSYMGIIQACAFFFGHGSGNFISRALGARKEEEAETMASVGFFDALIVSSFIAALCGVFIKPVIRLFGATPTVLPYAVDYFKWILAGTPFIVGTFVLNNQMRHQGNAGVAMWGILSGALLNIVLDPILIFALGMGVSGAGLATAISQAASFTLMLFLSGRRGGIMVRFRNYHPTFVRFREITAGGVPSLARQGLMALAVVFLNNYAAGFGDEALAGFSIVGRVMHLASSAVIGFGQGFQPVCGYNYGARMYGRLRRAFWFCVSVSTAYCILVALFGIFCAPGIIRVFRADDPEVIYLGSMALRAQSWLFPLVGFIVMTNMYLQTTRQVWSAIIVAVARHGLFLIPTIIVGAAFFGFNGLVAAQPAADILSFLVALPLCVRALRRME